MDVTVTVYRDQANVYTTGIKQVLDSKDFIIRGTGYISTVDRFQKTFCNDMPDLTLPYILATLLDMNDGRLFYVSETPAQIDAQIATTGLGSGNYEFLVQFKVGQPGAPANLATQYENAEVVGDIQIQKNGAPGYLLQGIEGDGVGQYALLDGGGFELINGWVFSTDELYTVFKVNN